MNTLCLPNRWSWGHALLLIMAFVAPSGNTRSAEPTGPASSLDRPPPSLWTRPAGDDWPQFLGLSQNGKSSEQGIRTDWPKGGLPLIWQQPLGTSYGIASISGGRLFQLDRVGDQERLTCLVAETGKELWRFDQPVDYRDLYGYNNGPRSSPTVDGGRVYTLGVAGRLCCVSAESGKLLWMHELNEKYQVVQNFFGVSACPLVVGDLVIVMVGGSPKEDLRLPPGRLDRVQPNGSALVAFDKRTGTEVWRGGEDTASYSTPIPALFLKAGTREPAAILAFTRSGLLAVQAATGKQLWLYPWRANFLESVNAAVPVLRGDEVLISECYQVGSSLLKVNERAFEVRRSDSENRRTQSFRAHWATPIEADGFLYGCSGRNEPDSDLRCVQWSDGEPQWVDPRRIRTSLLYVDGHFVVLDERGKMELIKASPKALEVVSSMDLGSMAAPDGQPLLTAPCWAAPVLAHGLLFVRGENRLCCFELIPQPEK
jgi:outer membrane protein assembly factor BamB